jgi:hypothetical protein
MKSIKYIIAALIAVSLTVKSNATVTVSWGTASDSYISDSGGAADDVNQLAPGDLLELGTWGATQPTLTSGNIQSELSSFSVFASGSFNGGGTFGLVTPATASPTFDGKQIVIIAYNQATSTVSPTPGVTEVAVFYENAADVSAWLMPADSPTASTLVDVGDLFVNGGAGNAGAMAAGATILWGASAYDSPNNLSLIDSAPVIAVPEPSSIVLVVMGLLGGIGMIRRRRS